ncbi:MAG TPA: hypothetical protein VM925_12140 [Labilithrix sp.]|nr:hypothetical protein [Labilithrix sp.]
MTPRTRTTVRSGVVLAVALLVGGSSVWSSSSDRTPTYAEDVAPILMSNCVGCHREGGIAPFSLLTYEQAKAQAAAIKDATSKRRMPPFNLDNSGACNTYADARWLEDTEIATIGSWVTGGTPLGDPKNIPATPPPPPSLDRVDLTIDMGTPYTPNPSRMDDYRCFVLDPGLENDQFITAFEVRPGDARVVHHLTLFALDTDEAERAAAKLDDAEPGPGYTCFGDTRVESRWLVGSGPGGGVLDLPKGTGLRMRAGHKTVLQMHYNRANGTFPDRTKIDLKLAPSVGQEAFIFSLANYEIVLPPKLREVSQSSITRVPDAATLWGLWPHMHTMGTKLEITVLREREETCVARVNRWNFHWQGFANYTQPIRIAKDNLLKITCTYDTSGSDKTTTWGSGTDDEMCIAFIYTTAANMPSP